MDLVIDEIRMKSPFVVVGALRLGVLATFFWALLQFVPDPGLMKLSVFSIGVWDLLAALAVFWLKRAGYQLPGQQSA